MYTGKFDDRIIAIIIYLSEITLDRKDSHWYIITSGFHMRSFEWPLDKQHIPYIFLIFSYSVLPYK